MEKNDIVITNYKESHNKDEIHWLTLEAENLKYENDIIKKNIEAKNKIDKYCYTIKLTLEDNKLKDKFRKEDKDYIKDIIDEVFKWENDNPSASEWEYDYKSKEIEAIFNPIMQNIYQKMGDFWISGVGIKRISVWEAEDVE